MRDNSAVETNRRKRAQRAVEALARPDGERAIYYRRDGSPIWDTLEWGRLFGQRDPAGREYRRVAETQLPNGFWVSTVWLGLDHAHGQGPLEIFETMVFAAPDPATGARLGAEQDCARYATEPDARNGHERTVEAWRQRGASAAEL